MENIRDQIIALEKELAEEAYESIRLKRELEDLQRLRTLQQRVKDAKDENAKKRSVNRNLQNYVRRTKK